MTFEEHKETTAKDCEGVAQVLTDLAKAVCHGDLKAFERFWFEGGTEEGDAKIQQIRESLMLRYVVREDLTE